MPRLTRREREHLRRVKAREEARRWAVERYGPPREPEPAPSSRRRLLDLLRPLTERLTRWR